MNTTHENRSFLRNAVGIFWNFNERRLRALWRVSGALLILIFITLISGLMFVLSGANPSLYLGQLQANIASVIAVWLAARFLDRRPFSNTGVQPDRNWWVDLGFGLALGALLMGIIFLVEFAVGWVTINGTFRTSGSGQPFFVAILLPAFFYLVVGISEELVFRGYLLLNLAEGLNLRFIGSRAALVLSWLLTSGLFGLAHALNPHATTVSSINIALAGLSLGLGYVLTGSLAIPIGIHIAWNFFQGHVFGFAVSGVSIFSTSVFSIEQGGPEVWTGGPFGPEGGMFVLFASLLEMVLIALWVRARYGKLSLFTAIAEPPSGRQVADKE